MGIQTVTIKTCDRCGSRIHELSKEHPIAGELVVTWKGHYSAYTVQGDAGGMNIKGAALLCHSCAELLGNWIAPQEPKP